MAQKKAGVAKKAVRAYGRLAWKNTIKGSTSKKKIAARGAAGAVAADAFGSKARKSLGVTRAQVNANNKLVAGRAKSAVSRGVKSAVKKIR